MKGITKNKHQNHLSLLKTSASIKLNKMFNKAKGIKNMKKNYYSSYRFLKFQHQHCR